MVALSERPRAAYPPVLVWTGENDSRCAPWHARKFAARLQAANHSESPILLRARPDGGHLSVGTDPDQVAEWLGFLMLELGLAMPQPRSAGAGSWGRPSRSIQHVLPSYVTRSILSYMSTPASEAGSIAVRLRDTLAALPRSERGVARTLLNAYPIAGLGTLAELATRSGVSTPTVLRLLSVGFEGFTDFQRALHVELHERLVNVCYQGPSPGEQSVGAASLLQASAALEATIQAFSQDEFDAAVRLLADTVSPSTPSAARSASRSALLLASHLSVLRPRVECLAYGSAELIGALAQAGKRDVLVVYDFRRYSESALTLARHVAEHGGWIVLITDRWLSPVATHAESVLVARTESVSPFDSLTAATAFTEALIAGTSALLEPDGRARADAIASLDDAVARGASRRDASPEPGEGLMRPSR